MEKPKSDPWAPRRPYTTKEMVEEGRRWDKHREDVRRRELEDLARRTSEGYERSLREEHEGSIPSHRYNKFDSRTDPLMNAPAARIPESRENDETAEPDHPYWSQEYDENPWWRQNRRDINYRSRPRIRIISRVIVS